MNLEKTPTAQKAFDNTMNNGANMNTDPIIETTATENTAGPMDVLRAKIEAAAAEAPAEVEGEDQEIPVTIADVAAAAFVALETIVQILKPEDATKVLDEFDKRKAAFRVEEDA